MCSWLDDAHEAALLLRYGVARSMSEAPFNYRGFSLCPVVQN